MAAERGLTRRLGRELLLQAVYISVAVVVGVFAVALLVEDVLIEQALQGEADYYWQRAAQDPRAVLPDTLNLTAYREGFGAGVPPSLTGLEPGFHKLAGDRETLTLISDRDGQRLFLVFEVDQVDQLVTTFGIVPLAIALTVIYLSLYSAYRVSRRAVSPLVELAQRVQQLDPAKPDAGLFGGDRHFQADDEIQVLQEALQELVTRVLDFSEREQRFTRDVSHELRTPLTVISMAADKLLGSGSVSEADRETLLRIKKSARDMEQLTSAFLLLAREGNQSLQTEQVCVNDLVTAELERARIVDPENRVEVEVQESGRLLVTAPAKVVESVVGNLIRNAMAYTDQGRVTITLTDSAVVIADTGPGMDAEVVEKVFQPGFRGQRRRGGFGVGLTIVKRLTDRFSWPLHIESEPGHGTRATVTFPRA